MLEIEGLCAGYGGRNVLGGVELCVHPGEVAALLGLNGSGKSTLLRVAMGLMPASAGRVTLWGEDMAALSARERARRCAYVPQRSRVADGLTALEVVLMGANAHMPLLGSYTATQRAQARACLTQMGAQELASCTMGALSEGQKQLVVFARALMQRPRAYLLDEPDGALDWPHRYAMMHRVRALARGGYLALVALHDAGLALNLCDRVLILQEGRVARALDLRTADDAQVEEAMRALYGAVSIVRGRGGVALAPRERS